MTAPEGAPADAPTAAGVEALAPLLREIEEHVAAAGWDQGVRLFALVPTADLLAAEPGLAAVLGGPATPDSTAPTASTATPPMPPMPPMPPSPLTPVEQEELPDHASLEELLRGLAWPDEVAGAALVVERVVLPAEAEADLPLDEDEALAVLAGHPARQDVRMAVAALRDGSRLAAMRFRQHDDAAAVLLGPELVPGLTEALAATLEP